MQRADDIEAVRDLAPFCSLAPDTFEELTRASYLQRFPRHVTLIEEGQPADTLHVVIEGAVEMFTSYESRRTTMAIFGPVTAFILAAVVRSAPNLMSARTLEPSRILLIPAEIIQDLIRRDNGFALAMIDQLALGFRTMVKSLKDQKLRSSQERVANYLLRLHTENGASERVELPIDKTTLAALLGMTRENLSRSLAGLSAHGVEIKGRMILFHDPGALSACAQPDPLIDESES